MRPLKKSKNRKFSPALETFPLSVHEGKKKESHERVNKTMKGFYSLFTVVKIFPLCGKTRIFQHSNFVFSSPLTLFVVDSVFHIFFGRSNECYLKMIECQLVFWSLCDKTWFLLCDFKKAKKENLKNLRFNLKNRENLSNKNYWKKINKRN